jgi:Zn-dependent peptidase ImmA (M78 family)/transcriptional regulator with XRE-family HTH domain
MLILARESRRMTQKALAEASNTSQSSVSRAEAGVDRPSAAAAEAWASVLQYDPTFFELPDSTVLPRTPLFRKRAALRKIDTDAIAALVQIRCRQVDAMARAVEEIPDESVPKINLDAEGMTPAQAAQWVRAKWRLPAGPIENMARVVEDHGIVVARLGGVGDAFMGVSIVDAGHPIVLVSSDAPGCRDRWTLAHELGHIVLHHHRDNALIEHCEEEADEFASEFLMPAHEIRHQFGPRLGLAEIGQLKRHWRTSMQALIMRAFQVRRISESQKERLFTLIGLRGYRRQEPIDVGVDEAEIIDEMVRVHMDELGFSVAELAKVLWLQQEEFRNVFLHGEGTGPGTAGDGDTAPKPRLRLVD